MSSGEPPAPIFRPELDGPGVARGGFPSRTDVGARDKPTNRRRVLAGLAAFLLLVLVVGGLAFGLLGGGTGHPTVNGGNANNGGGAPVIVGTDTPTPTPTLLPGQTPLPTAIPATALPPGAAPPAYASSGSINFKRATQGLASSSTVTVSTSAGDSRLKVVSANDSVSTTVNATGIPHPGQPVKVNLSVHNPSQGNGVFNNAGDTIPGNGASCKLAISFGFAPGETRQQECDEPEVMNPAATYSYADPNTGLQYTGNPNPGPGGFPPYSTVPANCGDVSGAQAAAKSALLNKLGDEMGGSSVYLSLPDLSYGTPTCSPAAGATIPSGGTIYSITITASGSQAGYFPNGVATYQQAQVGPGVGWQIIGSNGCSPSVQGGGSLSSATVACKATATEAWNSFNLGGMAQLIHGQTQGSATSELNAVQGVIAGSETYSLSGGSYLPTNAGNISFHYSP